MRQHTGWGDSQLKKHLSRLEDLEYLALHRGAPGQSFVYALNFEMDANGRPVLPGLSYGANRSRSEEGVSRFEAGVTPSGHGQDTGVSRGGHDDAIASNGAGGRRLFRQTTENTYIGSRSQQRSANSRRSRTHAQAKRPRLAQHAAVQVMARIKKLKSKPLPGNRMACTAERVHRVDACQQRRRVHGLSSPRLDRDVHPLGLRARHRGPDGSDAARAPELSAASLLLPPEERRAA